MTPESRQPTRESESQEESPYNPEEVKWLEEQKADFLRLKAEDTSESRKAALEIAKAVKKLKVEKEPVKFGIKAREYPSNENFEVDIEKYNDAGSAIIINNKLFFRAIIDGKWRITDGHKFLAGTEAQGMGHPFEHQGKMAAMGFMEKDSKWVVMDEDSNQIAEFSQQLFNKVISVGDKIVLLTFDDKMQQVVVDQDGNEYSQNIEDEIDDIHELDGEIVYIVKRGDKKVLMNSEGNEFSREYNEIKKPFIYNDKITYMAVGDKMTKEVIGNTIYDIGEAEQDFLVQTSSSRISAAKYKDGWVVELNGGGLGFRRPPELGVDQNIKEIYEIKQIDDEFAYALYKKDGKIRKTVFNFTK